MKYRDQYGPGGFPRLLDQGAWFGNAHRGHAVTFTGPGHATILTGIYPYRHGIIANDWIDRGTLSQVYCAGDAPTVTSAIRPKSWKALPPRKPAYWHCRRRAAHCEPRPVARGRDLRQGPRRDPARRQAWYRIHVHGRGRPFRQQHVLHEGAPGRARALLRRQAAGPLDREERVAAAAGTGLCAVAARVAVLAGPAPLPRDCQFHYA